ncbi:MAG: ribonuclease III [Flavobacteriales bacterium]|nr:ribonuclease III [Flavobacteriales bacterium]
MFTQLLHYFSKKSSFEKKLYTVLGYYPKNRELYRQALTHKSYKKRGGLHNERLEFLGDAVLGFVVGEILYQKFPKGNEGFLTQMRSKIVSRKTLNKLALEIKLNKLVRYHKSAAHQSLYGNALEALVGAIYLDKGHHKVAEFIQKTLLLPHLDLNDLTKEVVSYKSKILEWGQQNKKKTIFKVLESTGKDHKKLYKVALLLEGEKLGEGTGSSIKRAEEQAAQKAQSQLLIK